MGQVTVRDWMHQDVITCHPDTPVDEVAETLDVKDISALVVVDGTGNAIGVISRTDLVNARFIQPYLKHWRGMMAEHLMSKPVISVAPDTEIKKAVEMLHEKRIHLVGCRGIDSWPYAARGHPVDNGSGKTCRRMGPGDDHG